MVWCATAMHGPSVMVMVEATTTSLHLTFGRPFFSSSASPCVLFFFSFCRYIEPMRRILSDDHRHIRTIPHQCRKSGQLCPTTLSDDLPFPRPRMNPPFRGVPRVTIHGQMNISEMQTRIHLLACSAPTRQKMSLRHGARLRQAAATIP